MSKSLKQILLAMARLPAWDQRWILKRLPSQQFNTLKRLQGLSLLETARRFRTIKVADESSLPDSENTPSGVSRFTAACLAEKPPLYAAIVLEQGSYAWQDEFLQQCDRDGRIRQSLESQVPDIKEPIKQALFSEWESTLSFEAQLEKAHG